jgi:Uma2 family endonuclease
MSTEQTMSTAPESPATYIPKLQPGDRLTRDEFRRRYQAMPECKKAELIEGVVYMPSPVRLEKHGEPHFNLVSWLGTYRAATPFVRGGDNTTDQLDLENEPQPDCMLFIDPVHGGQVRITADDYVAGPPEFIAEISATSLAVDRGPKLRTFLRHGVCEYLIWRVEDRCFEWNVLRGSDYELLKPDSDEILRSEVFPGLWLAAEAMLSGDLKRVLEIVQQGIASPEHERFVETIMTGNMRRIKL